MIKDFVTLSAEEALAVVGGEHPWDAEVQPVYNDAEHPWGQDMSDEGDDHPWDID